MTVAKNMLGIQFEGAMWECIREIPVDKETETLYVLRPKINKISHRLVVDVKLKDNIKVVTFRSVYVIENRTLLTIELLIVDEKDNSVGKVYQIGKAKYI